MGFLLCVEMKCIRCLILTPGCVWEEDSPSRRVSAGLLSVPHAGDSCASIYHTQHLGMAIWAPGPPSFRAGKGFKDDMSLQAGTQIG